jgi:hypothetical protein
MLAPSISGPFAPSHIASYPAGFSPVIHQPLTAYPAAAFPAAHAPMGVPYFSGAAMPMQQNPSVLANAGILGQSMPPVARQGKQNYAY